MQFKLSGFKKRRAQLVQWYVVTVV